MLSVSENQLLRDSTVRWTIEDLHFTEDKLKYYDKDGFELCHLEREFYRIHGYRFGEHLNHHCVWQENWLRKDGDNTHGLIVDHSMILHRCDFTQAAREQLEQHRGRLPRLDFLMRARRKWGLDMALDWADEQGAIEVIHIEMDSYDYDEACEDKIRIQEWAMRMDWEWAAKKMRETRSEWQDLTGFAQNDWKARYFGFPKAERTQKSG
jgi:hypothetical protein